MSGTLFIMYGMLWGVNQGYLDADEYLPSIRKAWKAACDAVSKEGALGWVQPIADKPGHYSGKDTEVYGAGAYLMAGSELRKYVIDRDHPQKKTVTVTNPLGRFRPAETVSVPWPSGGSGDAAGLRVFDVRHGRVIPHQLADTDGDGTTDTLLFQSNFRPGTVRDFWILENSCLGEAPSADVCFSRPVPERLDDFAWEMILRRTGFTVRPSPGLPLRERAWFPVGRMYGASAQALPLSMNFTNGGITTGITVGDWICTM